jgi:CarboxypepD_reg-like domain
MMRKLFFLFALNFFCCCGFSQSILRGKVISEETKALLPSVSVYINSTSLGTVTNDQGQFVIDRIPPGKFRLVATSVGYETWSDLIDLHSLPKDFVISLKTKGEELEAFSVTPPDPDGWEKYGKYFKLILIGSTPNSNDCKLMNPEVVKFRLNKDNTLVAFAREPLQVTNYELGYEIRYKLEEFEVNLDNGLVNYSGYAFYKDLAISHPKRTSKYAKARLETYLGSLLHFMRAFYADDLQVQGFEMHDLGRISNPEKDRIKEKFSHLKDSLVQEKSFNMTVLMGPKGPYVGALDARMTDSTLYFKKMLKLPDSVISHQPVSADSIGFAADSMIAGLYFSDSLEVSYKLREIPPRYKALSREHKHETYPISQFVFVHKTPVYVISNGFYYKPYDLKITGFWAWYENMSTWLPYDFQPGKK